MVRFLSVSTTKDLAVKTRLMGELLIFKREIQSGYKAFVLNRSQHKLSLSHIEQHSNPSSMQEVCHMDLV